MTPSPYLEKQLADQQIVLEKIGDVALNQTEKRKKAAALAAQQATAIENLKKKVKAVKDAERAAKFPVKK